MTLRIIQVGLGVRGKQWAKVIAATPGVRTVAYVARRLDVLRCEAAQLGQADVPCFTALPAALAAVPADVVLLVSPPEVHHEQALAAASAGCHLLIEKPLAEDWDETVDIVRQAERHKVQLTVGMNFRYLPTHQEIRRIVRAGDYGQPSFGQFTYIRNRDGRRPDLNKYPLTMPQPMLLEQSIHHLDLMRYCYDDEVESVLAETWNPAWSVYQDDSCVSVILRFRSGLRVNYLGTWTSGWNRFDFRWRTDFPGGVLVQKKQFSDLYAARLDPALAMTGPLFKDEAEPLLPIALPQAEHFIDDTRLLLARFVEAIQAGKPVETSGKDHLKSLALVHAIIESAVQGKRVALADFYACRGLTTGWLE